MLDRDERKLRQLERANISGGLPPSVTLLRDLIKFLNQTKTLRGKRIVMILEKMLELEELTQPIKPEEPMIAALEWKRTDPEKFKMHWEIEKRTAMLRKELSKYRFVPRVAVLMGGGGQGPSQWGAWWKGETRPESHLRFAAPEALEMILKLTEIGDLTRLRRCSRCKHWLFARFTHQMFCSTKCQQKNYTQTEEFKKHRAKYMRKRYRQLYRKPRLGTAP